MPVVYCFRIIPPMMPPFLMRISNRIGFTSNLYDPTWPVGAGAGSSSSVTAIETHSVDFWSLQEKRIKHCTLFSWPINPLSCQSCCTYPTRRMEKKIYMKKSAKLFGSYPASSCRRFRCKSCKSCKSSLQLADWLKLADSKMQPGGRHDVHMCIPKSWTV